MPEINPQVSGTQLDCDITIEFFEEKFLHVQVKYLSEKLIQEFPSDLWFTLLVYYIWPLIIKHFLSIFK